MSDGVIKMQYSISRIAFENYVKMNWVGCCFQELRNNINDHIIGLVIPTQR